MITPNFGQGVPASYRLPFNRPKAASFYTPNILATRFETNISPFSQVMQSGGTFKPRIPRGSGFLRPGVVPGPEGMRRRTIPGPRPSAPVAGAFGAGPYTGMRSGAVIPYHTQAADMRYGVTSAPELVKRLHWDPYPYAAVPAGAYRR